MTALKQVGLRLTEALLERVDQVQEDGGGDSRSETLRQLIEVGLERDAVTHRLAEVEARLNRIDLVLERIHELSYISARGALDADKGLVEKLDAVRAKAKSDLANILVNRFGQ